MDWTIFVYTVFVNFLSLDGYNRNGWNLNDLIDLLQRRSFHKRHDTILRTPQYPEDLPAAEPILPGHTLLRPSNGMLRSAIKYPLRDVGGATVYGNLDNLGITYGKTRERIRYTDFRKANSHTPLQSLLEKLKKSLPGSLIVIEVDPAQLEKSFSNKKQMNSLLNEKDIEEDNNGSEILDSLDELFEDSKEAFDFRRKKKNKSKFRTRGKQYPIGKYSKDYKRKKRKKRGEKETSESSSLESLDEGDPRTDSDTSSSSVEKNPGNPFTIHKNKYKQNWMWNHFMDGDHMNINPLAPPLNSAGPTGADLFFGRKWWYFNQDDYKPLR